MRKGLFVAFALLVAVGQTPAQDVLDRALEAHGGKDALAKAQLVIRAAEGKLHLGGQAYAFTGETIMAFPDRMRWTTDLEAGGKRQVITLVINGFKGWRVTTGMTQELGISEQAELQEEAYVAWLMTLLPLKDKSITLEALPETKFNDLPARGLKVSRKGYAEVKLWFDRQARVLVRVERRTNQSGAEANKEYVLSDYRDNDGVILPWRHVEMLNGKKTSEWKVTSYKFPAKVDDKTFERP